MSCRNRNRGPKESLILSHPVVEQIKTARTSDFRSPAQLVLSAAYVADKNSLIAGSPAGEAVLQLAIALLFNEGQQFEQRKNIGRSTPNVISLSHRRVTGRKSSIVSIQQIVNEKNIPNLLPITVDRDRAAQLGCNHEPCHPTLIFCAELAVAVNAGLAKHDRSEPVDAVVVHDILISRTFRAAVGRMEIQIAVFGHTRGKRTVSVPAVLFDYPDVGHLSIDFVGGSV